MSQFYDSLKSLVRPGMVTSAARTLDEKEANISTAISSIFASLLGVMSQDGNTPQIRNILDEAGNLNILSNVEPLCEEKPNEDQRRLGDAFLQQLLGDRAAAFTAPIAKHAGISKPATNRLVAMLAPIFVGYFGRKLVNDGWSMQKIQNEIKNQKNSFIAMVPDDLANTFGLSKAITSGSEPAKKEKKNGWIMWVIIILLLLLILFLWRSCRNRNDATAYYSTAVTDTLRNADRNRASTERAASYSDPTMTGTRAISRADSVNMGLATREMHNMRLADGTTIHVYNNGTEQEIVKFLESDEYKKADDNKLQDKWFEFDNIAFEFGSGTQLKSGSKQQLDNIVAILKNHPDAKVRIATFADKRGTEAANMEVSKERARTIEKMLDQAGVGSQVVTAEGYGDEYAKYSANAPESQRAEDRDLAMRFVKR